MKREPVVYHNPLRRSDLCSPITHWFSLPCVRKRAQGVSFHLQGYDFASITKLDLASLRQSLLARRPNFCNYDLPREKAAGPLPIIKLTSPRAKAASPLGQQQTSRLRIGHVSSAPASGHSSAAHGRPLRARRSHRLPHISAVGRSTRLYLRSDCDGRSAAQPFLGCAKNIIR